MTETLLDKIGDWNPQLLRELKGRVTQKRAMISLLFSTDLDLSPLDIYRFYTARFQIEFIFRDARQFTGLSHCQQPNN